MKRPSQHIEWLSLIEVSGPFLAVGLLEKAFPQGLEAVETPRRQKLRAAYDEWCEAVDEDDAQLLALHREWVQLVLADILEYSQEVLFENSASEEPLEYRDPEHGVAFAPSLIVRSDGDAKPRLLISVHPPGTDLEKVKTNDGWPVSLMERMLLLCRSTGVRLGLLTNGDRWMLVNAPVGATSSHASWYARLWFQEPLTLKAFQSLLGVRRFFGPKDETLDSLLEKSFEYQEEVTDTLGAQVRRAVEVLVQCLDKADQDRNRELLRDVSPSELYEAGLTVMMRLVFVLCAEERGLLLLGDPVYDQCYAVSTLRGHLGEAADRHGPEVLERRHDAWTRLLSVFRAVYGGIEHESLRLPAMGGSLFDPDRFPFLEGRLKDTRWRKTPAAPLPIDNRTVLLLLEALQVLEQPGGALLLSYRALDVEQIGHVYEGLLEHTVARVPNITVGLIGSKKAKNPNLPLADLESARMDGEAALLEILLETTQRSEPALRRDLAREFDPEDFGRLLLVCGGDVELAERIRPFASLLRTDAWGEPIVYRAHSFMVTLGVDRRETGTHYTPKSLTESIVSTSLEPVAYVGPIEGLPRSKWRLKSPSELLNLKICDPAMGSGAFLVQVCRSLAERVVEAWAYEEGFGRKININGEVLEFLSDADPMPDQIDDRLVLARRLVAERCIYGVDVNPLAVELAKLSIWLVTLAKGRPFGFLDHNLRHGDSLLGIHSLEQLTTLRTSPDRGHFQQRLFGQRIAAAISDVTDIRMQLRSTAIRDIHDVETMEHLDQTAKAKLVAVQLVADAMIGEWLASNGNARALDSALDTLSMRADNFLNGNDEVGQTIANNARCALCVDLPEDKPSRDPFHWPLEFPEVFQRDSGGFDAMVGNPPFMGGLRISELLGESYNAFLGRQFPPGGRLADLCAFFFRRCGQLVRHGGTYGLLSTNTIAQGVTRKVGLSYLLANDFAIYHALKSFAWPGKAAVIAALVHLYKGVWNGVSILDNVSCHSVNSMLVPETTVHGEPFKLTANKHRCYEGSTIWGEEFIIPEDLAKTMISEDPRNRAVVKPVIGGMEINRLVEICPQRWAIDMGEMDQTEAETYRAPFSYLRKTIYPKRKDLDPKKYKRVVETWWKYFNARQAMYGDIREQELTRVLARSRVSDMHIIEWLPADVVYTDAAVIFLYDAWKHYAVLQSSLHEIWARCYASTLKNDMRYITSACFDTFPFPDLHLCADALEEAGECHYRVRASICLKEAISRGSLCSQVNDPRKNSSNVNAMREAIRQLDVCVLSAYGWPTIETKHCFRTWYGKTRFCPAAEVCEEIAERLLMLNHERRGAETEGASMK